MQKKKAIWSFLTLLLYVNIILISPQMVYGLESISTTGPYKFTDEVWTLTWGAPKNDRGFLLIDDPKSGDLFWGKTYENSSTNTLGVISRVSKDGEIRWSKECSGFLNIIYSKPVDFALDSEAGLLYVLLAYSSFSSTKLAILAYSVETGVLNNYYAVTEGTTESAVMDWDYRGNLLILYETSGVESKTYARHFIIDTKEMRNAIEITSSSQNTAPIALNGTFRANRAAICLGKTFSGGENRVTMVYIDTSTNPIAISTHQDIGLDSNDYFPIGMAADNQKIYLFVSKLTACGVVAVDDSFSSLYWRRWIIDNVFWTGFLMTISRDFYLLGYGTQAFGLEPNAAFQGILLKIVENEQKNGFRSVGVGKFGNPSYPDYFTAIFETSNRDLFITGYGKSYGTSPYDDFDAYLIKYIDGCYNMSKLPPNEPSFFEKYMVYFIVGGIAILTFGGIFTVRYNRIKRKT